MKTKDEFYNDLIGIGSNLIYFNPNNEFVYIVTEDDTLVSTNFVYFIKQKVFDIVIAFIWKHRDLILSLLNCVDEHGNSMYWKYEHSEDFVDIIEKKYNLKRNEISTCLCALGL